jgi:hypothetical protein
LQQFAHGGGTDAGKFRLGEEQDGFYAGQFAVDVGNGFLVFFKKDTLASWAKFLKMNILG